MREKVTPGTVLGRFCVQNQRGHLKNKLCPTMGEQREVLGLHHKHGCVCVCECVCTSSLSEQYLKKDLAYQLQDWSLDSLDAHCFLTPQINIKLIMAKTKEMLSEQYLKKDLAYQLQTCFVDWSWDPPKA